MFSRKNILSPWFQRLFQPQLVEASCHSRVGDATITLSREYVQGAENALICFLVKWPWLTPHWKPPPLTAQVTNQDDVPLVQSVRCVCRRMARTTRFEVECSPVLIGGLEQLRISVRRGKNNAPVFKIIIDCIRIDKVLCEIQCEQFEPSAWQKGRQVSTNLFHDRVRRIGLSAGLRLNDREHAQLLDQLGATLHAELFAFNASSLPIKSWSCPLRFGKDILTWDQRLGSAKNVFANGPGRYCLRLQAGSTHLAVRSLRVVTLEDYTKVAREDLMKNSALWDISLTSADHRGVRAPLHTVAEDFQGIHVSFTLDSPPLAPLLEAVECPLTLALSLAGRVLHTERRTISLKGRRQGIEETLLLKPAWFDHEPGKCQLELFIGDRLLKVARFLFKPRTQLKAETAAAIMESLTLSAPRLFARREDVWIETDHVFETDCSLKVTFGSTAQGFNDDVPAIQWRLNLKLQNLDNGKVVRGQRWLRAGAGGPSNESVELSLHRDGHPLWPGRYELQLGKADAALAAMPFRLLAIKEIAPYTEKLVLRSLCISQAQMDVQAGTLRYQSTNVSDTSDFLLPRITIRSEGYNAYLPKLETKLRLFLRDEHGNDQELATLPATLKPEPLVVGKVALRIRGGQLLCVPGCYFLVARIADRELRCGSFRLIAASEVMQAIRVCSPTIQVFSQSNRSVKNPPNLYLDQHSVIGVTVGFEVGILAPNLVVEGVLVLDLEGRQLGHTEFKLRLEKARLAISTRRLNLAALDLGAFRRPRTLTVIVWVAGREKGRQSVAIHRSARITNFEGQLSVDSRQLEIHQAEYQRILSQL